MLSFLLAISDEKDRAKVEEIYIKYRKIMYAVARNKLSSRPNASFEAEEAVQNAFIKIIDHFDSIRFDESEERLRAYFISIATNEAINIINKQANTISIDDVDEELFSDEDFVEKLCLHSEYEYVKKAIMNLDERYRIVLLLRYVEDMEVETIANTLNMKKVTVYANIRRGKLLLLNMLKKEKLK